MGKELCQIHGGQIGQLCCPHVEAATRGHSALTPNETVRTSVDLLDDGTELMPIVYCQECAAQFGITQDSLLPSRVLDEEGRIPYCSPRCGVCFDSWRKGGAAF
jgi:hypothetical protein